jgi:GMP synthase-like glutamine amidotransferase
MRILIIDNNIDPHFWGAGELRALAAKTPGATVWVRRAPTEDLPRDPTGFDRIIVSGSRTSAMDSSPWVLKLHEFLKKALNERKPMLGVCYGHQALVRVIGGDELMRSAEQPELGWTEIEVVDGARLFEGLPKRFHTFSSHFQEVAALPPGLKLTTRSERCQIQGFEMADAPVFGVQFHPERGIECAKDSMERYVRQGHGKLLLRPKESEKLYDPTVAEIIFRNFLNKI